MATGPIQLRLHKLLQRSSDLLILAERAHTLVADFVDPVELAEAAFAADLLQAKAIALIELEDDMLRRAQAAGTGEAQGDRRPRQELSIEPGTGESPEQGGDPEDTAWRAFA